MLLDIAVAYQLKFAKEGCMSDLKITTLFLVYFTIISTEDTWIPVIVM